MGVFNKNNASYRYGKIEKNNIEAEGMKHLSESNWRCLGTVYLGIYSYIQMKITLEKMDVNFWLKLIGLS
jgi:hypothetical protein